MENKLHEIAAANSLAALGNVTRLHLFRYLVQIGPAGATVGAIQRHLQVPGSTLFHHVAALTKVGLVVQEKKGREVICRANYAQMDDLLSFLTENCCTGVEAEMDQQTA